MITFNEDEQKSVKAGLDFIVERARFDKMTIPEMDKFIRAMHQIKKVPEAIKALQDFEPVALHEPEPESEVEESNEGTEE